MSEPIHPVKWCNDDKLVHLLKEGKVVWAIEDVRLNDINFEESKKRQSRFDRVLDQDRVLSIAIAEEEGTPIPRMCIIKVKGIGYIILAGLHRGFGTKLYVNDRDNQFKITCYVIKDGDQTYIHDHLPALTNGLEGVGLTMEQRKLRASEMILTNGAPLEEVAAKLGLNAGTLEKYISSLKIKERLIGLGVEIKGSLNKAVVMESLRGLSYSDSLLKATATLFSQSDVKMEEAKSVVRKVKAAGNEGRALIVIGEESRNLKSKEAPERAAWSQSPRRSHFLRCSTQILEQLSKYGTLEALQVTVTEDREMVEARIRELIAKLQSLLNGGVENRKRA